MSKVTWYARNSNPSPEADPDAEVCLCGVCNCMLYERDFTEGKVAQHIVWDIFSDETDSVDYIELAHVYCARKDNEEMGNYYWDHKEFENDRGA
jgi:hypothetical protein